MRLAHAHFSVAVQHLQQSRERGGQTTYVCSEIRAVVTAMTEDLEATGFCFYPFNGDLLAESEAEASGLFLWTTVRARQQWACMGRTQETRKPRCNALVLKSVASQGATRHGNPTKSATKHKSVDEGGRGVPCRNHEPTKSPASDTAIFRIRIRQARRNVGGSTQPLH